MKENSLLLMFSGTEVRKTNDEFYPFYTDRNFLYLTGLDSKELILFARKDGEGQVREKIFLLPPDLLQERWTGVRIKPEQAEELSGITEIGYVGGMGNRLPVGGQLPCNGIRLRKSIRNHSKNSCGNRRYHAEKFYNGDLENESDTYGNYVCRSRNGRCRPASWK